MANDSAPSAKKKFPVKGATSGIPGNLGLADAGPAGSNYPASDLNPKSPDSEYSADADRVPNPVGRLVIPEGA
jgi:hypothetical protein